MATNEQYENLPGVKVSYEDGNLFTGSQVTQAATQSILIIGTAIDGPVGEPISVNAIGGPKAAEKMFGGLLDRVKVEENGVVKSVKVPHQGTLIRAMYEAIRSGNEDVRLLRVSGKTAKTELPAKDPNSEVLQPLADVAGNNLMLGNKAFDKALALPSANRLIKIEKIEEFAGTDTLQTPVKTYPDATGYVNVDATAGNERVFFGKDMFRPKNTLKITYKAAKRSYTEVTRNEDGETKPSTKGLLTQDPAKTNYFSAEVGNWSDDPLHAVNVYVITAEGDVNAIPSTNASGEFLWRIGKEDATIVDELKENTTASEFKQGGIRFTSAYQQEVSDGIYPALAAGIVVKADYYYYNDLEVVGSVDALVPGEEKVTFLKHMPISDSLNVYYETGGIKHSLTQGTDFTITFPSTSDQKMEVRVQAGVAPVGVKLFAQYQTGENSTKDAVLEVQAISAGSLYGTLEDLEDPTTLTGVTLTVEYEVNENGTLDMENRVIRFMKPSDKKLTSSDNELRFRTKDLKGIRTLREFANYVNSLATNNIVFLDVPIQAGGVSLKGLQVTDYTISPITQTYDYRPIHLGEKFNENSMNFELFVDEEQPEGTEARFPWLGSNGFFSKSSLLEMKNLYDQLGGTYAQVEGTLDEYELVEQGIYSKLENYQVDLISLVEVNANTAIGAYSEDGELVVAKDRNFATQLAQHCAMVTAKTSETIGVIGMAAAPQATLREIQEYVDLVTLGAGIDEEKEAFYVSRGINPHYQNVHPMFNLATHEEIFNDDGEIIDIGRYINVVFGPEVALAHEKLGSYVANGATIYAALISTTKPEISTTNQQVSATGIRYTLSESQHNQLVGGRYVTLDAKLQANGSRRIVVKDGVTAALANSDFQRLSTLRITHHTVQLIRQKADKYIGLPNGLAQRNSLATEIQATLDKLKELGVLQNFRFSIYSSAKDRVLGNAFITLELVPAYEIRKIFTSVALRASL